MLARVWWRGVPVGVPWLRELGLSSPVLERGWQRRGSVGVARRWELERSSPVLERARQHGSRWEQHGGGARTKLPGVGMGMAVQGLGGSGVVARGLRRSGTTAWTWPQHLGRSDAGARCGQAAIFLWVSSPGLHPAVMDMSITANIEQTPL